MVDKSKIQRWMRELVGMALVLLVVLSGRASLADHYTVPTGSMQPTIEIGDRIFVNKLAYGIRVPFTSFYLWQYHEPQRGEVVVLTSPNDGNTLVKRIVGLPGDEIEVRDGRVFVAGEPVPVEGEGHQLVEVLGQNPHALNLSYGGGVPYGPEKLDASHYLLLGDNRGNSLDGRVFGPVPFELIMGRAQRVYYRRELCDDFFVLCFFKNLTWRSL